MCILNVPRGGFSIQCFETFMTTESPLLFHQESYKTSVQWDILWKTLALRTKLSPNPHWLVKWRNPHAAMNSEDISCSPLFSSRLLDWVWKSSRSAWGPVPILRSPWFFEQKAWTLGPLNLYVCFEQDWKTPFLPRMSETCSGTPNHTDCVEEACLELVGLAKLVRQAWVLHWIQAHGSCL